jgi:hypothetical protein
MPKLFSQLRIYGYINLKNALASPCSEPGSSSFRLAPLSAAEAPFGDLVFDAPGSADYTVAMRAVLLAQGVYYIVTGIWPLVSMRTFEAVTGPKTDDWLVQTVGVLAATIGATLVVGSRRQPPNRETLTLAALSIVSFTAVDVVFVANGTISRIYLVDAGLQAVFAVGLLVAGLWRRVPG